MPKVITAAKKKSNRGDTECITNLLWVVILPACYMDSKELRGLRRILRYRNFIVHNAEKMTVRYPASHGGRRPLQ